MTIEKVPGVLVLLAVFLGVAMLQTPAHAACVPHTLSVEPARAPAGSKVTISGEGWFIGCNDTGQGTREPADTASLSVTQNGRVYQLGQAQADEQYRFSVDVRLPADLQPGQATINGQGKGGQASAALAVTESEELPLTGVPGSGLSAVSVMAVLIAFFIFRVRPLKSRAFPHVP